MEPYLTEEEAAVFRRGRNMGHGNVPKSASVAEYRRATGMEVLFGYLHLTGQSERMNHLFRVGYGLTGSDSVHNSQSGETPT
jgi:ribonuclease-3 family protein